MTPTFEAVLEPLCQERLERTCRGMQIVKAALALNNALMTEVAEKLNNFYLKVSS